MTKSSEKGFVKLDFTNAFNTISRDAMLAAVDAVCSRLLPLALSAYAAPSILWMGDTIISSERGVQQGDPLGPLLFSLTLQPLLMGCNSEFKIGYLDDLGMGDCVINLISNVKSLELQARTIGLELNHTKCEVVGLSSSEQSAWRDAGFNFIFSETDDASFLGSPMGQAGLDVALARKTEQLKNAGPRLALLPPHEAFFLIKSSFAVPKLLYLLRTAPACMAEGLCEFNVTTKDTLSSVLNIALDDKAWAQAALPVRWGGLGVRDVKILAPSAYLSSQHSTSQLVRDILPNTLPPPGTLESSASFSVWQSHGGWHLCSPGNRDSSPTGMG